MFEREKLIIDDRDELKMPHRLTAWGITLLFWGVMLYLWQPLISMLAWAFQIKLFYKHMVVLGGYEDFLALILAYAVVIICMGAVLLLWARINQWRFRGREKRQRMADVTAAQVAAHFGVEKAQLKQWQQSKCLRVTLDECELPCRVVRHKGSGSG